MQLPIDAQALTKKRHLDRCSLEESVHQNILMILISHAGEWRFDHSYGCVIWDKEFELMHESELVSEIKYSLEQTLAKHEPRLSKIQIQISIDEKMEKHEIERGVFRKNIRKRYRIRIGGVLVNSRRYEFNEDIFFSPVSLD